MWYEISLSEFQKLSKKNHAFLSSKNCIIQDHPVNTTADKKKEKHMRHLQKSRKTKNAETDTKKFNF